MVLQDGRAGARQAQAFFRSGDFEAAARAYRHAAATGTRNSYENFAYNAALSYLRAGQPEEAAERFRDLTLSGDQADPALPTGLALALHANALEATASKQDAAGLLKEAGEGFKEALRRAPADPATRDSLATVLQQWPEAREKAHIETLMETHSQTPAPDLAAQMLKAQRDIATEIAAALTNALPVRLEQMEALARRQRETADLWIPLKGKMMQAMAQEAQDEEARQRLAHFEGFVEATRNEMVDAADRLRDLDGSARELSETAGRNLYGMWKSIAPHAALLNEDILQQTNMMTATVSQSGPPEALAMAQQEARALTELFDERFQKEVPEEGLPAPPAAPGQTNAPAAPQLTAEDRAQIVALTAEAIAEQEQAMRALIDAKSAAALANEKRAHELLLSIRDLLPKPPPQDQQQQPQESPPQQGEQPQEQPPENGEDPPPEPDGQQPPPEPEEQQGEAETTDSPEDQDLEELLERALQREKEHEEDKRRRARALPPLPTGRDW